MVAVTTDEGALEAIDRARSLLDADPAQSATELEKLYVEFRDRGDVKASLEALRFCCYAHIMNTKFDEAKRTAQLLLTQATRASEMRYVGLAQMYFGIFTMEQGEHELAMEYYEEALVVAKEIEDEDLIARVQVNFGSCLHALNRYDEALSAYAFGIASVDPTGGKVSMVTAFLNVSSSLLMIAHRRRLAGAPIEDLLEEVDEHIIAAFSIAPPDVSSSQLNLLMSAHMDALTGRFGDAWKGLEILEHELEGEYAMTRHDLFETQMLVAELERDWVKLLAACNRAIVLAYESNNLRSIQRFHDSASRACAELGRFEHAYQHLSQSVAHLQINREAQSGKRSQMLQFKMEVEKHLFEQRVLRMRNQFLVERNKALELEANFDRLSGVLNRRGIEEAIQKLGANKDIRSFAIGILDIDFFKLINDAHGHAVGDTVIHAFAKILLDSEIKPIHVGRWGGEEFLVVLRASREFDLRLAAETLLKEIRDYDWSSIRPEMKVTASFGLALHLEGQNLDQDVKRADDSLYFAKHNGRDRWEIGNMTSAA